MLAPKMHLALVERTPRKHENRKMGLRLGATQTTGLSESRGSLRSDRTSNSKGIGRRVSLATALTGSPRLDDAGNIPGGQALGEGSTRLFVTVDDQRELLNSALARPLRLRS